MAMNLEEWKQPFIKQNNAYKGWLHSYKMEIPFNIIRKNLRGFLNENIDEIIDIIRNEAKVLGPLKLSFTMQIQLVKDTNSQITVTYYTRQKIQ